MTLTHPSTQHVRYLHLVVGMTCHPWMVRHSAMVLHPAKMQMLRKRPHHPVVMVVGV
jgi:hypothetical protein